MTGWLTVALLTLGFQRYEKKRSFPKKTAIIALKITRSFFVAILVACVIVLLFLPIQVKGICLVFAVLMLRELSRVNRIKKILT